MNNIENLLDQKFILKYFKERLLPHYPLFKKIKKVNITPIKKNIWENSYHVVIEYGVLFEDVNNKNSRLPIYCSAHDSEPRKNVYNILKFLWNNDFSKGYLTIPHPLFYSNRFNAVFYRGVQGDHLYRYIRTRNLEEVESIVKKTALWLAKLHKLPTKGVKNYNKKNSRIETVVPGKKNVLEAIGYRYPRQRRAIEKCYNIIIQREKNFLDKTSRRWLIHGDAHPENVIKIGRKKIAFIDFTDLCLADFTRDIGSFLQQLEYKCERKIGDPEFTKKVKKIFWDNYFSNIKIKATDSLLDRVNNYYNWTALRTAAYLFLKHDPQPEKAKDLLDRVKKNLQLKKFKAISNIKINK